MTQPALSVAAFSERILGVKLWDHQRQVAEETAFITVCAAARRTGKTECDEIMAMHTAFSYRNCKVVILSSGQDAARRLTESIGQRLNANSLTRGSTIDDFATRVRLSNGSEIISLPASQKQVRGFGKNVRLVILDEAGFMPGELWQAASYIALDEKAHGSRIVLSGTPWGPADHFFRKAYQAGLDGDPDYRTFHWPASVNPRLDHTYLERQRERVSPSEYAAEVLGEWSDAVGALIPRELLDKQTADITIPPLAKLHGPAHGILGCDWGVSYDRSAAVAMFRLPVAGLNPDAKPLPRFVAFPYIWPQKSPLHSVVEDLAANLSPFAYVAPEITGVGNFPSSELRRRSGHKRAALNDRGKRTWFFVNTTAASKTAAYGLIVALLERGQLILPRDPSLLRQLAGLRFEQGERGFMRIEAEEAAVHDDICDALMLCALPHRPPRAKRVACHLAALAGSSRAPADARSPEPACPVVQTGAGLRVAQVPTLQSVAGGAWTAYAPPRPPKPEGHKRGRFFITTNKQGVTT